MGEEWAKKQEPYRQGSEVRKKCIKKRNHISKRGGEGGLGKEKVILEKKLRVAIVNCSAMRMRA